jgi:hypothetical protein
MQNQKMSKQIATATLGKRGKDEGHVKDEGTSFNRA